MTQQAQVTQSARATHAVTTNPVQLDIAIIGAGFAGLYQLHRLRDAGFNVRVFEAGSGLGGVWHWNCYPGARTDSNGPIYQFSDEKLWQEFDYEELYPSWDAVQKYFEFVDDRLDLSRDIQFNTRIRSANFDEDSHRWTLSDEHGPVASAAFMILCTGFGSKPLFPSIEGLDTFEGEMHHTALWPQEGLDLTEKRVGVIGTGASGVQVVQEASKVASELTVFQRTPNLALPMRQRKLDPAARQELKQSFEDRFATCRASFAGFDMDFIDQSALEVSDAERTAMFEELWERGGFWPWLGTYNDVLSDETANRHMYDFWRSKVLERIDNPAVAEKLAPAEPLHPYGVKRPSLEQDYFESYNRENVTLIDTLETPITRITPTGIETTNGRFDLDILVLATGFDANTGGLVAIDITGTAGRNLKEKWSDGVDTFMGISTAEFPNMLIIYGPQSPSGFCNGPTCAELQGDEIVDFLVATRDAGFTRFESTVEAEKKWTEEVDGIFEGSLFTKAKSWYYGANVPGKKPQMLNYSGGAPKYFDSLRQTAEEGYPAFVTQ